MAAIAPEALACRSCSAVSKPPCPQAGHALSNHVRHVRRTPVLQFLPDSASRPDVSTSAAPFLVILTGAGISQQSGLHTFRDADGVWARVRLEDVATPEAFARDAARVHAFYNDRRLHLQDPAVQPNPAHLALARLEQHWPGEFLLITQNVDDLHERAGSRRLVHMHGELRRARCELCGVRLAWDATLGSHTACPSCHRTGGMRPDVVWFGEMPIGLDQAYEALGRCSLFASIGTSGAVYPAAQFVAEANEAGAHTVELNLEPSARASLFAECHHGPAATIVPTWVDRLLAEYPGAARSS